jgi:glycerate 2-kinase
MRSSLRRKALRIFRAAVKAAAPAQAVSRHLKLRGDTLAAGQHRYRFKDFANIYVIGAGKAGGQMAQAVERLLGRRITAGLVNVTAGESARLLVCLISGGASALLPLPAPPVTLAEKQEATRLLLHCGANIHEFNCVRKHISLMKGGGLARLAYPATVLTLILSDVIGDDLDVIGSGPTVADRTTFADAKAVFDKYAIWDQVPPGVRERLSAGSMETPKPGDPVFAKAANVIVGSNTLAVDAAAREARSLGFRTLVLSTRLQGEAREVARVFAAVAREIRATGRPVKPPACVIAGGETTVTIRGTGVGGRNQEFTLAAALDVAGLENVLVLSAGTDGADGPTDAAGAMADGGTVARGQDAIGMLANNDSYHFFDPLGDLIKTGPTGTNVADIQVILVS